MFFRFRSSLDPDGRIFADSFGLSVLLGTLKLGVIILMTDVFLLRKKGISEKFKIELNFNFFQVVREDWIILLSDNLTLIGATKSFCLFPHHLNLQ